MIERMEVKVPDDRNFDLADITIAGVPIRYGGQIAECITVKLTGIANICAVPLNRDPVGPVGHAAIDSYWPIVVSDLKLEDPIPPGAVEAFLKQGTEPTRIAETRSMSMAADIARSSRTAHSRLRL
jgi:hypothetical protein